MVHITLKTCLPVCASSKFEKHCYRLHDYIIVHTSFLCTCLFDKHAYRSLALEIVNMNRWTEHDQPSGVFNVKSVNNLRRHKSVILDKKPEQYETSSYTDILMQSAENRK